MDRINQYKNFYIYEIVRQKFDSVRHKANLYQLMVIDTITDSFYAGIKDDSQMELAIRYFIECADTLKTIPS